jgi:hypothetical protein
VQLLLRVSVVAAFAGCAQAPVPETPAAACQIALPYTEAQRSDCSPVRAAAYDFAFCSVHYQLVSLSAPASDKARAASAEFGRKARRYGVVSQALSDEATLKRNVELTKKFYESFKGDSPQLMQAKLRYVGQKCENVEGHHAKVMQDLVQKMRDEGS